jgi:hypothetical protein
VLGGAALSCDRPILQVISADVVQVTGVSSVLYIGVAACRRVHGSEAAAVTWRFGSLTWDNG